MKTVATLSEMRAYFGIKVAFDFDYPVHKCDPWLKIVNHWDKRDNSVLCADKNNSGFKVACDKNRSGNAYVQAFLRKKVNTGRLIFVIFDIFYIFITLDP